MKFSGLVPFGTSTTYLTDRGGEGSLASPQNYPFAGDRYVVNLVVFLSGTLTLAEDVTVTVLKDGAPTALTVAYASGDTGIKISLGSILFLGPPAPSRLDVRIVSHLSHEAGFAISATLGLTP